MYKPVLSLPANTPEYMAPAYYGCLNWAVWSDDIRRQFEEATGTKPVPAPPRAGIEAMIDKACGIDREKLMQDYFTAFKK